jgi:hypothetical protein
MRRHPASGSHPLPARPATATLEAGARGVRPAPVRLTRRGRVVVVLFLSTLLVVGGWLVSRSVANAATTHEPPAASVVAKPGDTLWSIAVRARPNTDPRITVDQIMAANRLGSPVLQPGQRVVLPRF